MSRTRTPTALERAELRRLIVLTTAHWPEEGRRQVRDELLDLALADIDDALMCYRAQADRLGAIGRKRNG